MSEPDSSQRRWIRSATPPASPTLSASARRVKSASIRASLVVPPRATEPLAACATVESPASSRSVSAWPRTSPAPAKRTATNTSDSAARKRVMPDDRLIRHVSSTSPFGSPCGESTGAVLPSRAESRKASALACLEALLGLVDDVDATLAPHDAVLAVAVAQGLERVTDLHRSSPGGAHPGRPVCVRRRARLHGSCPVPIGNRPERRTRREARTRRPRDVGRGTNPIAYAGQPNPPSGPPETVASRIGHLTLRASRA